MQRPTKDLRICLKIEMQRSFASLKMTTLASFSAAAKAQRYNQLYISRRELLPQVAVRPVQPIVPDGAEHFNNAGVFQSHGVVRQVGRNH